MLVMTNKKNCFKLIELKNKLKTEFTDICPMRGSARVVVEYMFMGTSTST